jgi:hypothetical protein
MSTIPIRFLVIGAQTWTPSYTEHVKVMKFQPLSGDPTQQRIDEEVPRWRHITV